MGIKSLQNVTLFIASFLFLAAGNSYAQGDNIQYLVDNVVEGKTYYLAKANAKSKKIFKEEKGFYVKIIPAKYKTVKETIVLQPALNGNLDTSNYFIETEVLVLREPAAEWKTAQVSDLCMEEGVKPIMSLCLLKMTPKYQIVNKKFFPFKNILDVSNTDFIIPERTIEVERDELVEKARLERYSLSQKPEVNPGEKLLEISAGDWQFWEEVICPFGDFNDPKIDEIQRALAKNGYKVDITNNYDEQTRRALHEFQADHNLEVGEPGDETINRLGVKRERLIRIDGN